MVASTPTPHHHLIRTQYHTSLPSSCDCRLVLLTLVPPEETMWSARGCLRKNGVGVMTWRVEHWTEVGLSAQLQTTTAAKDCCRREARSPGAEDGTSCHQPPLVLFIFNHVCGWAFRFGSCDGWKANWWPRSRICQVWSVEIFFFFFLT